MAKYSVPTSADSAVADDTVIELTSDGTVAPKIYDIIIGFDATPADAAFEFVLQRHTTSGTGTAITPRKLDPLSAAASSTAKGAMTVEGTITASSELLIIPMNQRATFRWVAAPGSEHVSIATAANGLSFTCSTAGAAAAISCTILFDE